jgi:hypothetical protein
MTGIPSLEGMRERFREADREVQWWAEHQAEFVKLYPDQFVAVLRGDVVVVASDLSTLIAALKEKSLTIQDVWASFIETDPSRLILAERSQTRSVVA